MTSDDLCPFQRGYVECALWTEQDTLKIEGSEEVDEAWGIDDFDESSLKQMMEDCDNFYEQNQEDINWMTDTERGDHNYDISSAGHDFWLTRNGHGAGFWDRGFGERGKRVSEWAKTWGTQGLYLGQDGKIYVE